MFSKTIAIGLLSIFVSCKQSNSQIREHNKSVPNIPKYENPYADIASIPIPPGFKISACKKNFFAAWLSHTPLKKSKTVYLYNGRKKENQKAQFAVLDIPVGNSDLQQCADAVMRLRASYLFDQKIFDSIIFFDNNAKAYCFTIPYTVEHFTKYLNNVFSMCGTASLSKQLKKINFKILRRVMY